MLEWYKFVPAAMEKGAMRVIAVPEEPLFDAIPSCSKLCAAREVCRCELPGPGALRGPFRPLPSRLPCAAI